MRQKAQSAFMKERAFAQEQEEGPILTNQRMFLTIRLKIYELDMIDPIIFNIAQ